MTLSNEEILRNHALSLTAVRLAVLDVLAAYPHVDAAFVYEKVQARIATASKQAIYNNLSTLLEHGLVREIKPKGHVSLYETRRGDNHHHIVCRNCKAVADTDCKGSAPCLTPSDDHGFYLDEAEVVFWGLCPSCQTETNEKGVENG